MAESISVQLPNGNIWHPASAPGEADLGPARDDPDFIQWCKSFRERRRKRQHAAEVVDLPPPDPIPGTISHDELLARLERGEGAPEPVAVVPVTVDFPAHFFEQLAETPALFWAAPLQRSSDRFAQRWLGTGGAAGVGNDLIRRLVAGERDGVKVLAYPRYRAALAEQRRSRATVVRECGIAALGASGGDREAMRREFNRLVNLALPRPRRDVPTSETVVQAPPVRRASLSFRARDKLRVRLLRLRGRLTPALEEVRKVMLKLLAEGRLGQRGWKSEAARRLGLKKSAFSNRHKRFQLAAGAPLHRL